ncbi:MAG TPA: type II CAAX endopeptidase family protein [Anaerolineae bacterium]
MVSSVSIYTRRHTLVAYFVLAYAITWAFEIPLAAMRQGSTQFSVPFAIHYLGAFGPMLAALIVTQMTEGSRGIRRLFSGLFKWRVGWGWVLFSVFSPIAMFVLAALAMRFTTGEWPNLYLLGEVDYLPYLGIVGALILWFLTWGLGEEVGWRGFALPRLQKDHSALTATIILGVFHAFWHLPAFFYKDAYLTMGLAAGLPMLVISVIAAAIVFTWIYNSTRGSLLMVVLFHALFDMLSVSRAGGTTAPAVMSAVVWVLAVVVVIVFKPANLSPVEKQVA